MSTTAKRLLFLSSAGEIAGSEIALLQYLERLDGRRYTPLVVCCQPGSFPDQLQERNIPTRVVPLVLSMRNMLRPAAIVQNIRSLHRIYKQINDDAIDLVWANDTMLLKALFLPLLLTRKPILFMLRNYERKRLWMVRRLLRKHNRMGVAVSRAIQQHYKNIVGLPEDSLSVVHVTTPLPTRQSSHKQGTLKRELKLLRQAKLIGLIARFDVWKGHLTFLRAAERVVERHPHAHFVIVGETLNEETFPFLVEYKAKVLQYASRPALANNVHLLGWRNDMPNIYRSLDVVVSASEDEPFALAVLEGLAYGVPVVGADSGGTPEIITHEKTGLLFITGDGNDLADCLIRLLSDKRLAARLASGGKKTVSSDFTMEAYIKNIDQLYNRILD